MKSLLILFLMFYPLLSHSSELERSFREGLVSKKYTLPNGLEVFITENPKAPLVSVYHWVKAGSLNERKGVTGIAHLFEHMMFRPVTKGAPNFFDYIQKLGGSANANTRYMATVYTTSAPTEHLGDLLKIESNRFRNLNVTDELLDIERKAVWSEYSTKFDTNPVIDIWGKIYEVAFKGHPYEWTIIGYREDLEKIKAKDANEFFQKYYRPNNIGLFISGDVSADRVMSLVKKYYATWKPGVKAVLPEDYNVATKMTMAVGRIKSKSKQVLAGFRIKNERDYGLYYRFINHVFFSSENSLANRRLKVNKKYVSSISDFNYDYDSGMIKAFMISLVNDWNVLVPELMRLKSDFNKLTDEEFEAYKTEFLISTKEAVLRNDSYNEELAFYWGKLSNVDWFFNIDSYIKNMNKKNITNLLNEFYVKSNLTVVRAKN